ncbi:hypothetical protein JRQ81_005187, partial [Phrynocephalus forsythii]
VCFRLYTEEKARKAGVVGWVKNTRQGTVTGQVQGPEDKVNEIIRRRKYPSFSKIDNNGNINCISVLCGTRFVRTSGSGTTLKQTSISSYWLLEKQREHI